MSEYQYYEFQAIDRPLSESDMEALRSVSTRARITATSFTNHYEWGDFKGNPRRFMERWFDLHVYLANWGTRRLMIRLPKRLVDLSRLESFLWSSDLAQVLDAGENLILDIHDPGEEGGYNGWVEGSGCLAALAPLRADFLSGDWRLAYLLWLAGVDSGDVRDDALEPLAGIGPLNGGLEAFADFFRIDADLVQAAAEASSDSADGALSTEAVEAAVASIPEGEKTTLLRRLVEGDPHLAAEVRRRVREVALPSGETSRADLRTASGLRLRAAAILEERKAAEAEAREAERIRQQRKAEETRRARLDALRTRGETVWREVESEIAKRNGQGYDMATALLFDLRTLAMENGTEQNFFDQLDAIRLRHERKKQLINRLVGLQRPDEL